MSKMHPNPVIIVTLIMTITSNFGYCVRDQGAVFRNSADRYHHLLLY